MLDSLFGISVIDNVITFVLQIDVTQHIIAIEYNAQEPKWTIDVGAMFASDTTPVINGNSLYIVNFKTFRLMGIDVPSGKVLMNATIPSATNLIDSKITIGQGASAGLVFFSVKFLTASDYALYILAYTKNGELAWKSEDKNNTFISYHGPAAISDNGKFIYQVRVLKQDYLNTNVFCYDALNGTLLWTSPVISTSCFTGTVMINANGLLSALTCSSATALSPISGKVLSQTSGKYRNQALDSSNNLYDCKREKSVTVCEKRPIIL